LKALFCEHGQDENPRTLIGQQQRFGIVFFLKALLLEKCFYSPSAILGVG
jgi:hypothetical protein